MTSEAIVSQSLERRAGVRLGARAHLASTLFLAAVCACGGPPAAPATKPQRPKALVGDPAYDFSYDQAGRLSSVAAPSGEAAQYVYDPAGNIVEIRRFAAGSLTIMGFFPSSGPVGQTVTVTGAGFSTTPAQNAVQLNGVAVTVLTSTATQLTFSVPPGAASGPITVAVGATAATTDPSVFTVTDASVVISDFAPKLGRDGTAITVSGGGFDPVALNNRVYVGHSLAISTGATTTSVQSTVSGGGPPGKVRLSNAYGSATSSADFYFLPGTYAATDIVLTDRMSIGETKAVNIGTAGKTALIIFDADQGQCLTSYITNVTLAGTTLVKLYGTDSSSLVSSSVTQGSQFKVDFGQLLTAGTYTIAVQAAATSVGTLNIQLVPCTTGTLVVDGPAIAATLSSAQNGRYTFSGTGGQHAFVGLTTGSVFASGTAVSVYDPAGSRTATTTINSNFDGKLDLGALAYTGPYAIVIVPSGVAGGSFTVRVASEATGTLTVDAPAASLALGAGQNGRYTFDANAGDLLGFALTSFATSPTGGNVDLQFLNPNGSELRFGTAGPCCGPTTSWQLPKLTATGTYTLRVTPRDTKGATFTVLLSRPLTGTLTADGVATHYETARAAQSGRYTFTATAGQGFTVEATSGAMRSQLTVYDPGGNNVASASLNASSDVKIDLGVLRVTGTYTVGLVPTALDTGYVDIRLISEATGTLTVDGPGASLSLGTGQNGRYTFSANSGDLLGFALTSFATTPTNGNVDFQILSPSGSWVWGTTFGPCCGGGATSLQLPQLTATGTYTLRVIPQDTKAVSFTLLLSTPLTGLGMFTASRKLFSLGGTHAHRRENYIGSCGANICRGVEGTRCVLHRSVPRP